MRYTKYSDELVQKAITICKDNGLVEKWQPVLFAGIHCYEQGSWQEAFPFLKAATLRGNLIAYEYLQAMSSRYPEQLAQSKAQHSQIYQRYESLEHFPPRCVIGKDWVKASNNYSAIMALRQQCKTSNSQAKKLKNLELALLSQCGDRAKNQRANELYWKLNPSKLDSELVSYLVKSCSVLYRNYLVTQDKRAPLDEKKIYLKQMLTLFKAIDGDKDSDGIHAFQCAKDLPQSVEKKTWHIIAAHFGDSRACAMLSLKDEPEELISFYSFWIYRGATLGEEQLIVRLLQELLNPNSDYRMIKQELEFWCREHIQAASAPLGERFTSSQILAETILKKETTPSINTLHSLRELLEAWQASLEALSEHPYISHYHALFCKIYTLIDKIQPEAQWLQQALHHASKALSKVENRSLLALYEACRQKRPNVVFDEVLMEKISQQMQANQYAPFFCVKEVRDLEYYLEHALQFSEYPIDYHHLKRVLDILSQYHQQGDYPEVTAWGILETFSHMGLDMRQLHSDPIEFMQPYLKQLESQIQNSMGLQAMMHFAQIRYGNASKMHLAQLQRLYEKDCENAIPLIGDILEKGVPDIFAPKPQKAARFYQQCLTKKLQSDTRLFCLTELGKLYLNYDKIGIEKDEAISYLKERKQQHKVAISAYNLGLVYAADRDTLLDALPWFKKAALMGDVDAMHELGCLYGNITIAECYEPRRAFHWLFRSLAAGRKASAYSIGAILFNDAQLRCPENKDFREWHFLDFMTLAATENANAQYFLAVFYLLCHGRSDNASSDSGQLHRQGLFYLNQAKENGLLLEAQHVTNMLEMSSTPTLPSAFFDALLSRDFQSAWDKLGLAQPEKEKTPNSETAKSATPLERSQQKSLLLPRRLQESVEDFLNQRKLTGNDFIQLLKKFCHEGKANLNESAAGSRVTFTQGQLRFTFHPPHNRSEILDENRRHDYQGFVQNLMNQ